MRRNPTNPDASSLGLLSAERISGGRGPAFACSLMAAALATIFPGHAAANPLRTGAMDAFATSCFSPYLTAQIAKAAIAPSGARHDFYDLNPFSDVPPSPSENVTPGTDRRCEVTVDGDHGTAAAETATAALAAEGITRDAPLPATHADAALPGTTLLVARFLNPARIAVVHTGIRPGPNGPETFLTVERLTPNASREALQ